MNITLTVIAGHGQGKSFTFDRHETFFVGRGRDAHFQVPPKDAFFSRLHFLVEVNPPRCALTDLGSSNGTFVNGRRVSSIDLNDGDLIQGGETVLQASIRPGQPSDKAPDEWRPLTQFTVGPGMGKLPAFDLDSMPSTASLGVVPRAPVARSRERPPTASAQEPGSAPRIGRAMGLSTVGRAKPAVKQCAACAGPLSATNAPLCDACENLCHAQEQPIAGYRIVRELGRGSMGVVSLALAAQGGAPVALKRIAADAEASENEIARFVREARILRDLSHPNIVGFRDIGPSTEGIFFAMEYVPGENAEEILRREGKPLSVSRATSWVCQLLDALGYAHEKGFVHRDIKPQNLLVSSAAGPEVVKLADFGLARAYQSTSLSGLTIQGDMAGTFAFMAPEQLLNCRDAKPTADIYSTAALLYTLLCGRFVYDFPASTQQQVLMILQREPVPLRTRRPDIPAGLASVVHQALARAPEARIKSAVEMRAALRSFAGPC